MTLSDCVGKFRKTSRRNSVMFSSPSDCVGHRISFLQHRIVTVLQTLLLCFREICLLPNPLYVQLFYFTYIFVYFTISVQNCSLHTRFRRRKLDHRLNGSLSPVLTATPHSYGKGQIRPPTKSEPVNGLEWNLAQLIISWKSRTKRNLVTIGSAGTSG